MINTRQLFHYISYLQYPLVLTGVYYAIAPYFSGFDSALFYFNKMLVFMGLSISFSTLQDTRKTQNAVSRKIWQDPIKGKIALIVISVTALFFILVGFYGIYGAEEGVLQEVSFGVLVLGIGFIGMLKAAIEMFENHRKDKNPGESGIGSG